MILTTGREIIIITTIRVITRIFMLVAAKNWIEKLKKKSVEIAWAEKKTVNDK